MFPAGEDSSGRELFNATAGSWIFQVHSFFYESVCDSGPISISILTCEIPNYSNILKNSLLLNSEVKSLLCLDIIACRGTDMSVIWV